MKILVVDDEKMIRFAFEEFLKDEGIEPLLAPTAESALKIAREHRPEIVFIDHRLPGKNGLELLSDISKLDSDVTPVFMTAFGALDLAIKAMQLGAYEYITKPLDLDKVRTLIHRIAAGRKSLLDLAREDSAPALWNPMDKIVGKGPAMQEIFKTIGLLSTREVTVLITGESGVGKELVARAIHENSNRSHYPFVAVNCAAMPETLLEAEMFGHEKGAFTGAEKRKPGKFESANGGSIFLDEIGELHPSLQVKLLRVLQERSFERIGGNTTIKCDVRVIAATNRDLHQEVALGRFRSDLFYRLYLIHIHIPPLRQRKEDIPLLIDYFIRKAGLEFRRKVLGVTPEAMDKLMAHDWPGNVRELENELTRAMVLTREDVLPDYVFVPGAPAGGGQGQTSGRRLAEALVQYLGETVDSPGHPREPVFENAVALVERTLIEEALRRTEGNQVHAAALLGMNRSTLRKKKSDYGI